MFINVIQKKFRLYFLSMTILHALNNNATGSCPFLKALFVQALKLPLSPACLYSTNGRQAGMTGQDRSLYIKIDSFSKVFLVLDVRWKDPASNGLNKIVA
jgi:hypothetical protein